MTLLSVSDYNMAINAVNNGLDNVQLLTEFDHEFLSGFCDKLSKYKRHTFMSEAQKEQFLRIEKYLKEELGGSYRE